MMVVGWAGLGGDMASFVMLVVTHPVSWWFMGCWRWMGCQWALRVCLECGVVVLEVDGVPLGPDERSALV